MNIQLHSELHKLNDNLINIRTVIETSDKFMQEQYRRHIILIGRSQEKIDDLQKQIDEIMIHEVQNIGSGRNW